MFKKPFDFQNHKKDYEINNLPSQTIPDQTLSIPELIKRYASGQSLGGKVRQPQWDEGDDILNGRPFASYDLSEQHDIIRKVKSEYNEIIQRHNENQTKQSRPQQNSETTVNIG